MINDINILAQRIVDELLTNAFGEVGTRLEIKQRDDVEGLVEDSLDGWSRDSAIAQVAHAIRSNVLSVYLQPQAH